MSKKGAEPRCLRYAVFPECIRHTLTPNNWRRRHDASAVRRYRLPDVVAALQSRDRTFLPDWDVSIDSTIETASQHAECALWD